MLLFFIIINIFLHLLYKFKSYNNKSMYIKENYNTEENTKGNYNLNINEKSDKKSNSKPKDIKYKKENINIFEKGYIKPKIFENKMKKKKKIPLYIFDIKIKEGLNKNIHVYEGDTSASIAKKLAEEYNLGNETQRKLENMIHEKLLEPLTKNDE